MDFFERLKNKEKERPEYLSANDFEYGCAWHHQIPHKDVKDRYGKQICRVDMKSGKTAIYEVERIDLRQSADHTGQYKWKFYFLGYLEVPANN